MRQNGEVSYLNAGGTVLGMFDGAGFEEETIELRSGDLICFYTDGIVDAFDRDEKIYGEDRLEKIAPVDPSTAGGGRFRACSSSPSRSSLPDGHSTTT